MHRSISKRDDSKKFSIEFSKYAHSAIICGQTSFGKTMFVLDLLELEYNDDLENILTQYICISGIIYNFHFDLEKFISKKL